MTRMQRLGDELMTRRLTTNVHSLPKNIYVIDRDDDPSIKPRDTLILCFLATLACSAIGVWIAPPIQQFINLLNH